MNASPAIAIVPDGRLARARKLFLQRMGRFSRAFGFDSTFELPEKPRLRHPVENLTVGSAVIYELRNGRPFEEYLGLPEVEVAGRLSFRELEHGRCEYRFQLNVAPDTIWLCFFKRRLPSPPVRFENNVMVLTCRPADLEWSYHKIKEAILQANLWYGEEWEDLAARVEARDLDRRLAKEMEENRRTALRGQFEGLNL